MRVPTVMTFDGTFCLQFLTISLDNLDTLVSTKAIAASDPQEIDDGAVREDSQPERSWDRAV